MYKPFTTHGYPLDEVASALQKSIRRCDEKQAMYWALELNDRYPLYVWRRLVVIACEDVGLANPSIPGTICALADKVEQLRKKSRDKTYDLTILGFAILLLARSPKSREADDLVNEVLRQMRMGEFVLDIPDWALDMHTQRGRSKGRGPEHFWTEGAKLENESHASKYRGSNEDGDGYRDANGKKVAFSIKGKGEQDEDGQSKLL